MDHSTTAESQIRKTIEDLQHALDRKDAEAVIACCGPDHVGFSLAPPLVDEESDAAGLNAWFNTWEGQLWNEIRDLKIVASGDVAFAHSLNRLRGEKVGGGPVDLWFRQTLGLRRIGADWKIVHEHASVPFYMDGSNKAALDLKP